jgi:major membrane immunogen (membrane-anchored lipoprotein)
MNLMRWLVLGLLLMSCDSGMLGDGMLTVGTYVGVFTRMDPVARYQPSNVTITVTGDQIVRRRSLRHLSSHTRIICPKV